MFCYLGKQFYGQACPTGQPRKRKLLQPGSVSSIPFFATFSLCFKLDIIHEKTLSNSTQSIPASLGYFEIACCNCKCNNCCTGSLNFATFYLSASACMCCPQDPLFQAIFYLRRLAISSPLPAPETPLLFFEKFYIFKHNFYRFWLNFSS